MASAFIQLHPNIRRLRIYNKRLIGVVFLLVTAVFFMREYSLINEHQMDQLQNLHSAPDSWRHSGGVDDDSLMILKAQMAHLKKKLAAAGKTVSAEDLSLPTIFVITPTYSRPVQRAELIRLSQTLVLVPNLHWILVEDSDRKSHMVSRLLAQSGLSFTHLNVETPEESRMSESDPHWLKPRGVVQRNEALHWIRDMFRQQQRPAPQNGVIYFADDDNTYHVQLFEEIRWTKSVSVCPVGLVGGLMVEKPKLEANPSSGQMTVVGWDVTWSPERPFAIDMAGFAVSLPLFLSRPKAKFAYRVRRGYQESEFLSHLVQDLKDLEPKCDECTKVWVWHTRTEQVDLKQELRRAAMNLPPSDQGIQV